MSGQMGSRSSRVPRRLIQNDEDNGYLVAVRPTLESGLTSADITGIGAQLTLLVFNNEVVFSRTNIDSLCGIGRSTKKGQRHQGLIGEKGRVIKKEQEHQGFLKSTITGASQFELHGHRAPWGKRMTPPSLRKRTPF
uniref:Uncharacterized protein n=1 Tax=Fagus sylvatica TaxID=28930 RepID=A0A2N9EDR4_FAGSY